MVRTITVSGMSCEGCEENVEETLGSMDGVTAVTADHEGGTVEVDASDDVAEGSLHSAIEDAGYEVTG